MSDLDTSMAEGYEARRRGDLPTAQQIFKRSVKKGREDGEAASLAEALAGLGQIERDRGRSDEAFAAYEESSSIARGIGDRMMLAHALRHMADLARKLGRVDEGVTLSFEAVSLLRMETRAKLDLANALRVSALLLELSKGDAKPAWLEAKDLYEASGIEAGVAECETHLRARG